MEDGISSDLLDLSPREIEILKKGAEAHGKGLLMFMADAALARAVAPDPELEKIKRKTQGLPLAKRCKMAKQLLSWAAELKSGRRPKNFPKNLKHLGIPMRSRVGALLGSVVKEMIACSDSAAN